MPFYKKLLPLNLQFFSEEGGEGEKGEGSGGRSGEGGGTGEGSGDDEGSGSQNQTGFSREYVQDLRNEAAKYRKQLRNLEGKTEAQKKEAVKETLSAAGLEYDENKSLEDNIQRVTDFKNSAEKRANDRLIQAEATLLASELGVNSKAIGDILKLMDKSNVKVKDDGSVEGLKESMEEFLKERPYYQTEKKPSKGGGDFSGGSNNNMSMNDLIRKKAGY